MLYWGTLSDRIGRKPVLLLGLFGVACSALLFGLSRTFLWAVLARALAGALNGNVAVVKSVVGEVSHFVPSSARVLALPSPMVFHPLRPRS